MRDQRAMRSRRQATTLVRAVLHPADAPVARCHRSLLSSVARGGAAALQASHRRESLPVGMDRSNCDVVGSGGCGSVGFLGRAGRVGFASFSADVACFAEGLLSAEARSRLAGCARCHALAAMRCALRSIPLRRLLRAESLARTPSPETLGRNPRRPWR